MSFWHRLKHKKNLKFLLIAVFIGLSLIMWISFKIHGYFYVNTDNAYVNANVVQIAPRVTGQVTRLYILNNQHVNANQPLFDIDDIPFKNALSKAQAQYAINKAALINAERTADRTLELVKKKFVSSQERDNVTAALDTAQASLELAKAALDQAALDQSWTKVTAPVSGWVTNISLSAGDIVTAYQPVFVLISDDVFWVDANFKETELENIHRGQKAVIYVDMYPGHPFKGYVESISGGTGSAFSLLPPQNATGNWVKVTQRIPVRVRFLNPDPNYPLRIGSSTWVRINLHSEYEAVPRS